MERVHPTATFTTPASPLAIGATFPLALTNAQVPGYSMATFTYAFDCGDGAGYTTPSSSSSAVCAASAIGTRTVRGKVIDQAGDSAEYSAQVTIGYGFSGFLQPVDPLPAMNTAKAGQAIPIKWRLVDASGAPIPSLATASISVTSLSCTVSAAPDQLEEYATGTEQLQNLGDGYYQLNWKSSKSFAGTCKLLRLNLGDGGVYEAAFSFTR